MSEMIETGSREQRVANWRPRVLLIGGVLGSLLGVIAAYLFVRAAETTHGDEPPELKTGDAVKVGTALLRILRQIADLGVKR